MLHSQRRVYDDENRLIMITNGPAVQGGGGGRGPIATGGWKAEFTYDGKSRMRIRKDYYAHATGYFLTNTTWCIYDGNRVVQERNAANTPTVSHTRGNDLSGSLQGAGGIGGLLARSSGYSGGNWTSHACYHADGNGNITCLINTNQSLVARYRHDPFGNMNFKTGALADANTYRFSSKEVHVQTGMYYYGYRFYDPSLQRWMNRDPLEEDGGVNLYYRRDEEYCAKVAKKWADTYKKKHGKVPSFKDFLEQVQKCMERPGWT